MHNRYNNISNDLELFVSWETTVKESETGLTMENLIKYTEIEKINELPSGNLINITGKQLECINTENRFQNTFVRQKAIPFNNHVISFVAHPSKTLQ